MLTDSHFFSQVVFVKDLEEYLSPVRQYKRRECYSKLHDYVYVNSTDKLEKTSFRYDEITKRSVIYKGESKTVDEIQYLNVEEYLCSI